MGLADAYDQFEAGFVADPYGLWAQLREQEPVARSEVYDGYYVVTRHEEIREAAADYERFSVANGTGIPPLPFVGIIPLDIDPPDQREYRRIINPALTADAVAERAPQIRALASELIDEFAEDGFDATQDYGMKLSPQTMLSFIGFAREDWPALITGIEEIVRLRGSDSEATNEAVMAVMGICLKLLEERKGAEPQGDLLDLILGSEFHGRPLEDHEVLLTLATLLVGAIDTTALAISSSIYYLATRPEAQRYVREHGLSREAVDELIRWTSPVQGTARTVTCDTSLGGCPLSKDDRVLLVWASGNRQESVFPEPDDVDFERRRNPHLAFGHGAHKCAGLHMGRLMLKVALEELLARMARFELGDPGELEWMGGEIRGFSRIPIRVTEWSDGDG